MKKIKFGSVLFILLTVLFFAGCKDDTPEEEVSPFVGNFVISHAEVAETFNLSTVEGIDIPVPVSTDITAAIQASLLSAVNCSSPDKSWIELRADKSIYMSCEGSNEMNAGTWAEDSDTQLTLNMNAAAIPSSPSGFVLTVSGIVRSDNGWTGKTSVPMPNTMFAAALQGYGFTIADTPTVYLVTFSLDFVKK